MIAAQTQSEVIGDNVANLKTPGYKEQLASNISFPSLLIQRMGGNQASETVQIGGLGTGVGVDRAALSNVQGAIRAMGIFSVMLTECFNLQMDMPCRVKRAQ
jgi:flagellar basal-body rod protein FlgF